MMAEQYVRAAFQMGWLLRELEQALSSAADGCAVDAQVIRTLVTGRLPTQDEIAAATAALADVGILRNEAGSLRFNKRSLQDTLGFRSGVWETLGVVRSETADASKVRLCVAVPPGLDAAIADRLSQEAVNLRAAILEIIAAARQQLILASPFWDEETADEVASLLARRLEAGVAVTLLGRFVEPSTSGMTTILRQLRKHNGCSILSWFSAEQGGSRVQTFHFKAAIADEGKTAYLGSANLNTAGLRSRMELGVILSGEASRKLYRVIMTALGLAKPAF